jgi:drug/metabolite transporter (DMT)-like permease
MLIGYVFLTATILAFGTLGIFHKVADHPNCRPKMTALLLHFWGGVLSSIYILMADSHGFAFPPAVLVIGTCTGLVASLTLFVFQTGLKYGKISTSWLIVNLTTAVPVLISIVVFNEKLSPSKSFGVVLVFAAIIMLWLDKRADLKGEIPGAGADFQNVSAPITTNADKAKWFPLMMITFLGQGLASSSQKVLVEAHVAEYVWQFLLVFYWVGFLVILALSVMREKWPNRREILTALVMAACSVVGNFSMTTALKTVKGSIAYPASNGSLLVVVLGGVLIFREKIHPIGLAGIACGICAILILL